MAGRSNYRVKVDLSKYHQDVRRLSWVYVDSAKVLLISHLKRHIVDVFGIREPFHLLFNGNEYLPPDEDVRILNDNESIVVVPGSGMCNGIHNASEINRETSFGTNTSEQSKDDPVLLKDKSKRETYNDKQRADETLVLSDIGTANATMYHSMMDMTEVDGCSDSERKNDDMYLSCSAIETFGMSSRKRKRTRRKKSSLTKGELSPSEDIVHKTQRNHGKPKILDSSLLPAAKHIRFADPSQREISDIDDTANNVSIENHEPIIGGSCPSFNAMKAAKLSALLGLGKCSSPLVFTGKKRVNGFDEKNKKKDVSSKRSENIAPLQNVASNGSHNEAKDTEEGGNYFNLKAEEYPSLSTAPEIDDIVAFKILRIGSEYTPEVSDFIVAKAVGWCPQKMLHTFEILSGHEQIEGPTGKFSLPENETERPKIETVDFNFSQLIDLRLISRK